MNHLNANAAAREQVTMMQRSLRMLSDRYSVLNRLVLVMLLSVCMGLFGLVDIAAAYSAGDPIYINTTASSYCSAKGSNFTLTVTLTDFAGNPVTGESNNLTLKKVEDNGGNGVNNSFGLNSGDFTDNVDGTYTQTGNINDNGSDPYYVEVEWQSSDYKMKSGTILNIATGCSSSIPSRLDSAPDFTYYPTSSTVIAKFRLLDQNNNPYTGANRELGNQGNGGANTLYINKIESINKVKFSDNGGNWTVSSAVDNNDGTYTFTIDYSGGINDIWVVEARYEYDSNGKVRLNGSFAFEINTAQTSGGNPTGPPPINPGAPELTTPPCGATTASDLAANAPTSTQVDLTWTYDVTNNNYYTVYRNAVQIVTNVKVGTYSDTNAAAGTTYAYTVRGYNIAGNCESVDSNTVNVTTPTCTDNNPSSISIPTTQTAFSDGFDASALVTTTGDPKASLGLQFRVTQQQTTAGTAINAGVGATNLSNDINTYGEFTVFGQTNPANTSGTIDHIEAWISSGSGQLDVIVGYGTPPNYTVRNKVTVNVTGTGLQTWNAPADFTAFSIQAGDYVGLHNPGSSVGYTYGGGGQMDYFSGDATTGTNKFTNLGADLSVYVTGTSAPVVNEVTCTNWTSTAAIPTTTVGGSLCGDYANGSYSLYSQGTDPTCGTAITSTPVSQPFTWNSCTETATLTLTPIANPIMGNVSVIATGTATGITVGTTASPTNASGWVYVPVQDDNTTTVSFYATGTGTCGPLTVSQLNVGTNTVAAPTVSAFSVPATVTAATLDVPITTFTATDNVAVTGYLITETPTTPLASAGWSAIAPATYRVASYGSYTLYGWAKDAAGNVSSSFSAPVTISNCTEVGTVTLDLLPNPITGVYSVTATVGGGASAPMISVDGTTYSVSPYSYTPPVQGVGTPQFWASATGTCGTISDAANPTTGNYNTRTNGTEAGVAAAAQSAIDSINVTMPYLGDKNVDATFQVDYKLSTSGTWISGTPTLDTGGSPYTQNITGLISSGTYDVRVTYADIDTILSGTATQNLVVVMVPWADNPMLHNSLRFTGTTKHAGNWGTPGNYAGGITCLTCHAKNSVNVKRIKASISFPDGGVMPGGGTSATVSLLTVEDGTSDFGDDSATRTSSAKICEVCHTSDVNKIIGVKQHAASQNFTTTHYNNADCIKCHQHNAGFRADCTTCHGNPPVANTIGGPNGLSNTPVTGSATSGKHTLHAVTKSYACNICHTGWEAGGQMPNAGNVNIGFSAFGDTTATYNGRTGGAYAAAAGTTTTTNNTLTCSAVYCHGTSTPKWLDTEPAMACGSCHGDTNGMPSTTAGNGDLSGATSGFKVGKHTAHVVTQGFACTLCHPSGNHTGNDINGTVDVLLDTAQAGAGATFTPGAPGTCSNLSCHSNAQWDSAVSGGCNFCHGYPPNGASGSTNHLSRTGNSVTDANFYAAHSDCATCHGVKGNQTPPTVATARTGYIVLGASGGNTYIEAWHNDGKVQMNGYNAGTGNGADDKNAGYNGAGGCTKACHASSYVINTLNASNTVELREFGAGDCNGCHDAGTGGAPVINAASSHVDADGAGATYTAGTCTDCHPGGTRGAMHSKNGDANVVAIANNTTVGINYGHTVDTGVNGFVLGGDATTGTTAAQICWNCHDTNGISEWGTNTDTNGGEPNYNFGQIYSNVGATTLTSNWVGSYWKSGTAMFGYKKGQIQSTHAANDSTGTGTTSRSGVDDVAAIRCSYCHDVHNTTGPNNKPYLRGTWMGNPYPEDGAPQSSSSYANNTSYRFGAVPRGNSGTPPRATGGYFIDQNRTTGGGYLSLTTWSLANNAGLCTMCHSTNVNLMNKYGTASTDWVGTNGHSNAVIGGTGSVKANIFDLRGGSRGNSTNPAMAFQGANKPGDNGNLGFRNGQSGSDNWSPLLNGAPGELRRYSNYSWGATVDGTTPDLQYHKFPCSKCHSPHASRLPRLMITNCLDTKHNSWDDSQLTRSISNYGSNNSGKHKSNLTSAQNCHRVGDPGEAGTGVGWNKVTPW